MKRIATTALALGIFVAGIGIGVAAPHVLPSMYHKLTPQEAAANLLEVAKEEAEGGSWEMIGIGRVLYLGGQKEKAEAIFSQVLGDDPEDSDSYRIAHVYAEAGEWQKAKPMFDRYVERNSKEYRDLVEIGTLYMLNGDRETAERLFDTAFKSRWEFWSIVYAAGAYMGVKPQG